jgi:hypothetical protein
VTFAGWVMGDEILLLVRNMLIVWYLFSVCLTLCLLSIVGANSHHPTVSLCLITKDEEEEDLLEWIEYHESIGVSNVIIVENDSQKSGLSNPAIMKYARNGFIRSYIYYHKDTAPNNQLFAYRTCLQNWGKEYDFMGFIDTDEFIHFSNYTTNIGEFLRPFMHYGGLVLNEMLIGSNGHDHRPKGGILKNYNKCTRMNLVKSIVMPSKVEDVGNTPHAFRYHSGEFAVDIDMNRVDIPWNPKGTSGAGDLEGNVVPERLFNRACVYHYAIKSRADFEKKRKRGSGDGMIRPANYFDEVNKLTKYNCSYARLHKTRDRVRGMR